MLGIPAKLAGCEEVILCTPPDRQGKIHPAILYCADLIGINRIFKISTGESNADFRIYFYHNHIDIPYSIS